MIHHPWTPIAAVIAVIVCVSLLVLSAEGCSVEVDSKPAEDVKAEQTTRLHLVRLPVPGGLVYYCAVYAGDLGVGLDCDWSVPRE